MNFREFVRFTYGLFMGTSTPFLKPAKRYLFPTFRMELGPAKDAALFLGGSGVCGLLSTHGETLVINTNQGQAAEEWRRWVTEKSGQGAETLILTSVETDFAGALPLFADAQHIYAPAIDAKRMKALFGDLEGRIESVTQEKVLQIAGETVRLIPVGPAAAEASLAVFWESRSTLFLGPLFYHRIHPILRVGRGLKPKIWIETLEMLLARFHPKVVVPGEGDTATADDLRVFIQYLKDLQDPSMEFSSCRAKYDWPEIPSYTSLEENFDLLRDKNKQYTALGT